MSQFRKRLTELFSTAYGTESNEMRDTQQSYASSLADRSSMLYSNKKTTTQSLPLSQSQQSSGKFRMNSNSSSYYEQKPSTTQSFFKKRGITTDILNDSAIAPVYTEKSSFSQMQTDTSFNSQLISYRLNSRNKHYSRIKKEIDTLSRSFKDGIIMQNNMNRPIVALNKPENFSINYVSSIAYIKERAKENRYKKRDQRYVAYPSANAFMMNVVKGRNKNDFVSNGKTSKPKQKIALKNDLDDLYEFLNQQKKNKAK